MTSTASLASNDKKQHALYILSDFLAWETLAASMTSTASTISVASMTFSASFHQKNHWAWFFHRPWHQNNLFFSDNVDWIIKNSIFSWFLTPFLCWGCGGQGCYFYPNQRVIGQMPPTQDPQTTFKPNLTCIFLSARARYIKSKPDGRPCM